MGPDEVDNGFREVIFFCQFHTFGYVIYNVLGTDIVVALIVRVDTAGLILDKKDGVIGFANIMIEGSGPCKQGISAYSVDGFFGQVGHHE